MTKSKPIIFSDAMVRAILEGRKTQTRRIVKWPVWANEERDWPKLVQTHGLIFFEDGKPRKIMQPMFEVGQRLWVKETWRVGAWDENGGLIAVDYRADNSCRQEWPKAELSSGDEEESNDFFERLWIQSGEEAKKAGLEPDADGKYFWEPGQSPCRWRLARFMPRFASRITLEITNVKVERLHSMTKEDAFKEGVTGREYKTQWNPPCDMTTGYSMDWSEIGKLSKWNLEARQAGKPMPLKESDISLGSPQMAYANYWNKLNGTDAWDANPFVYAIEFHRV